MKVRQWTELRPTETLSTAEAGEVHQYRDPGTLALCEQWLSAANRGEEQGHDGEKPLI